MSSETNTTTYTVADIRKVVDNFASDFLMMSISTGIRTRESVEKTVYDLKQFAELRYLIDVKLILKDASGSQIRAAVYQVSDSAAGWVNDRPGNSLWPKTPDGVLKVVATFTQDWWSLSDNDKAKIRQRMGMHSEWGQTSEDTTFRGLSPCIDKRYSSNGYGWERTNFE